MRGKGLSRSGTMRIAQPQKASGTGEGGEGWTVRSATIECSRAAIGLNRPSRPGYFFSWSSRFAF
jgi:hypothetical protein